jgi:hypothetical protein
MDAFVAPVKQALPAPHEEQGCGAVAVAARPTAAEYVPPTQALQARPEIGAKVPGGHTRAEGKATATARAPSLSTANAATRTAGPCGRVKLAGAPGRASQPGSPEALASASCSTAAAAGFALALWPAEALAAGSAAAPVASAK